MIDPDFVQSIKDKKNQKQKELDSQQRHGELVVGSEDTQKAILSTAQAIITANLQHQPNVSIKNFPEQLASSDDIKALREALEKSQSKTQDTTKNTSEGLKTGLEAVVDRLEALTDKDQVSDITTAIGSLEEEVKDKDVTVTNLDDLGDFFFSLEQTISKLELSPNIDVKAPIVNVEKQDISSIKKELQEVKAAIQNIQMPVMPWEQIMSELQDMNTALTGIWSRPQVVGGGGGTSSVTPTPTESVYDTAVYDTGTYS